MFKTKKDLDHHVRTAFSKLRSEEEKKIRGFTISKLYYKINEYTTAAYYITSYLSVREDCAPAHKLLGQCYLQLKKPDKALESFQRSLQLDPKQSELLIEICKLLLADNSTTMNTNKAQYWCDLAESERIQHDAVFNLRLKLMEKSNLGGEHIEDLLRGEIASRPNDISLKIGLMKHLISENKLVTAFKYAYDIQMKGCCDNSIILNSSEWYNIVSLVLNKYKMSNNVKSWQFWLLLIITLEKQLEISFSTFSILHNNTTASTEIGNLLFNFDQCLYEASQYFPSLCEEKEFATEFLQHYRGQLCLHVASLLFVRQLVQNKDQWYEATRQALPLLLFSVQCGAANENGNWLRHNGEDIKHLIQLWNREGSFRCVQAGRILQSCIETPSNGNSSTTSSLTLEVRKVLSDTPVWSTENDLLSQAKQVCSDNACRSKLFRLLFPGDYMGKMQTSFLINCKSLNEPIYELPSESTIESYEETAQYLKPQSLSHMVYLCLNAPELANVRCKYFSGLNFSTKNLSFCGAESVNQLDLECFLYAAVIQAQRILEVEKLIFENYTSKNSGKPRILPYALIAQHLCTEEQNEWWRGAYRVYKNITNDENLSNLRATLQYGIEAIRCMNGPKIDLIIVFKLGNILLARLQDASKPIEQNFIEARVENFFKEGLNMLKLHNKGVLEPFRKLFKYSKSDTMAVEQEINALAEEAITYLAGKYFKGNEYEECIEELQGIQLPFATYFQAEAYRKLDESNKAPRKTKKMYVDKARNLLNQTLNLLRNTNVEKNHPLNSIIHSEIERLQNTNKFIESDNNQSLLLNNRDQRNISSNNGEFEDSINLNLNSSRSKQQDALAMNFQKVNEIENLVKQIATTLSFLKEEIVDTIKPEITNIKKDMANVKEKIFLIEDNLKKKSAPSSRDEDTNVFDGLYIIDDELQNSIYPNQQGIYSGYNQQPQQQQQQHLPQASGINSVPRVHQNPNNLLAQLPHSGTAAIPPYNSHQMFNMNPNFFSQYMMPGGSQGGVVPPHLASSQRNSINLNQFISPYVDPAINFNVPPPAPPVMTLPPQTQENRPSTGLFNLLMHDGKTQQQQPSIAGLPQTAVPQPPVIPPQMQPASLTPSTTATPTWYRPSNNAPVEKGPPINVVITNSDPLPTSTMSYSQPTLSVTIPVQHIKPSITSNDGGNIPQLPQSQQCQQPNTNFPMVPPTSVFSSTPNFSFGLGGQLNTVTSTVVNSTVTTTSMPGITNTQINVETTPTTILNETKESIEDVISDHDRSTEVEYDPRPDFQPIIPLPEKIDVKTGEEDEEVLFCARAKLFRYLEKEWKERGLGDIKILKNKQTSKIRILMRREQTHKICANHFITEDTNLTQTKNEEKGFIWAANDFADEEIKLEKFHVRFKYTDTAKEFYNVFMKCRDEIKQSQTGVSSNINTKPISNKEKKEKSISDGLNKEASAISLAKSGKIDFTKTTPIIGQPQTTAGNNLSSPFADFNFNKNANPSKPLANLFSNIGKPNTTNEENSTTSTIPTLGIANTTTSVRTSSNPGNKEDEILNKSGADYVDDYVPTTEFKPVVTLPEVEVKTGEENEKVLFEHRAKLLRFDNKSSEWKERGIGNMKILVDKGDPNKVRLVMRREIIHKLCCNQRLTKDIIFSKVKNVPSALTWCGQDYSEEELSTEILTIRFKTAEICNNFYEAIVKAQSNITENENPTKNNHENEDTPKNVSTPASKTTDMGFGDKFKPKVGSWSCEACYTVNDSTKLQCIACESPKNDTIMPKTTDKGFGDKFKPKAGSWSCEACYTMNDSTKLQCIACEGPKDNTSPPKEQKNLKMTGGIELPKTTKFNFGFPSTGGALTKEMDGKSEDKTNDNSSKGTVTTTTRIFPPTASSEAPKSGFIFGITQSPVTTAESTSSTKAPIGFGDKFKPKIDSWKCEKCLVQNESDITQCIACKSPRDKMELQQNTSAVVSNFGTPTNAAFRLNTENGMTPAQSTFSFKNYESQTTASNMFSLENTTPFSFSLLPNASMFGVNPVTTAESSTNVNEKKISELTTVSAQEISSKAVTSSSSESKTPFNFALSKNPDLSIFNLEKKEFSFVHKPKSPGKGKSPGKNISGVENESDNEDIQEEENSTYFTPVIPLPDKVDVKTGEEDEEELYCHRAKLYRFFKLENKKSKGAADSAPEWKERGLGNVKILRHKETKKLRVLMRREQIHKICLNHVLSEEVNYERKDDKSWQFAVCDYSEGEIENSLLCLRFKTSEIAEDFMKAIKKALFPEDYKTDETTNENIDNNTSVNEKGANITEEEKLKADKLQLNYDFYEKSNDPCPGCCGCDPDSFVFPDYGAYNKDLNDENPLPLEATPTVAATTSNILKQSSLLTPPQKVSDKNFTTSQSSMKPTNVFEAFGGGAKKGIDLNAKKDESKSLSTGFFFGNFQSNGFNTTENVKSTFGETSLFGGTAFSSSTNPDKKDGVKNLFASVPKPLTDRTENVFDSVKSSINFGNVHKPLLNEASKATTENRNPLFSGTTFGSGGGGIGGSIFGGSPAQISFASIAKPAAENATKITEMNANTNNTTKENERINDANANQEKNSIKTTTTTKPTQSQSIFKVDENLSFANLAKVGGDTVNFSTNENTKEFIGLTNKDAFKNFLSMTPAQQQNKNNSINNTSTTSDGGGDRNDSEYDPHYEPIIELPSEIDVKTGEEDEEKIFGERATLYRYDADAKQWKERGVGEFKVLHHPKRNSYRVLLRREQILKLVLNHAITSHFHLSPFNQNPKAFCWAALNFAEEDEGETEKLAVRFKNVAIAERFKSIIEKTVNSLKEEGGQQQQQQQHSQKEKNNGN